MEQLNNRTYFTMLQNGVFNAPTDECILDRCNLRNARVLQSNGSLSLINCSDILDSEFALAADSAHLPSLFVRNAHVERAKVTSKTKELYLDLSGCDLHHFTLDPMSIKPSGVFYKSQASRSNFREVRFGTMDIYDVQFALCDFSGSDLSCAGIKGCTFKSCSFQGAMISQESYCSSVFLSCHMDSLIITK